jgi:uncharacterized protein (TIGR02444 family)
LATGEHENSAGESAFWRFSLALYKQPDVAEALIGLQDRDGFDVNLILFALWLGVSGRGALSSDALAKAEHATGALRHDVVEPLRRLRRKLRQNPDDDVQQLREGVKALELRGEKLIQKRLARIAGSNCAKAGWASRRAAAYANLALYLGAAGVRRKETGVILKALGACARDL